MIALYALSALCACGPATTEHARAPGADHATPPTCDAIVAHLAQIFGQHDLAAEDRASLIASCEKDDPPLAERTCVMAAHAPADVDACGREGAKRARAKAAAAPADPRADLLALGDDVYQYLRAMGEAPPAAGPTPAIGACCATACAADPSQWTGPWQLVRFGLEHPTAWSFAIEPAEGGAIVRATGCGAPAPVIELRVTAAAAPAATDVHGAP